MWLFLEIQLFLYCGLFISIQCTKIEVTLSRQKALISYRKRDRVCVTVIHIEENQLTFTDPTLFFPDLCSKRSSVSCKRCLFVCYSRKRAEAEGRKGSFPCSKAMSSHHPTDPVELRRINFQTPGRLHRLICSWMRDFLSISRISVDRINPGVVSLFSLPCISVPRLSTFVKLVGLSQP